jgi:hypothetical protein
MVRTKETRQTELLILFASSRFQKSRCRGILRQLCGELFELRSVNLGERWLKIR